MSAVTSLAGAARMQRLLRMIDVGAMLPGEAGLQVAVEVCWHDEASQATPSAALVCIPGGGMNRRFFDLIAADGSIEFSFAEQLCARGYLVILVDSLGVGDSSRPADLFALTPELLVQANTRAIAEVVAALREGTLTAALPALPMLQTIGVGHSMGAVLTILQQANSSSHAAVAVLGFSTAGLPQYLDAEVRARIANDPAGGRTQLAELARAQFGAAPSATRKPQTPPPGDLFAGAKADPRGMLALKAALAPLLPVPAYLAMLPGNVAAECARLDVPVFIAVGELDLTGPAEVIPAAFSASPEVSLQILAQSGHSHFLFPARTQLFERLAAWAATVTQSLPGNFRSA